MTVNSILRSMAASARRAERESLRNQREYQKHLVQQAKFQAIEEAELEVEEYENRIELLKSMHTDCSDSWDWQKIKESTPPPRPTKQSVYENLAIERLKNFKPSLADKLFNRSEMKRSALGEEVELGKEKDEDAYQKDLEIYKQQLIEWEETRELARKILDGDTNAYLNAIEQIEPLAEISEIGSSVNIKIINESEIDITLQVNSSETIPSEIKTQLKSGKLSIKEMPKAKFNELYQDYVCSCVLRVAREMFALLPIKKVYITAVAELLNSKTGHIENLPILSVLIPGETLIKINFSMIDPSDSMKNFVHNMKFKKTSGFEVVDKLNY